MADRDRHLGEPPKKRPTRIYRLDVTYPEGCDADGWHPATWEEREYRESDGTPYVLPFQWPVNRLYLSRRGAEYRASLFEQFGATVTIVASEPVAWPICVEAAAIIDRFDAAIRSELWVTASDVVRELGKHIAAHDECLRRSQLCGPPAVEMKP